MRFYETGRLYPYRDARKGFHGHAAHLMAYESWASAVPGRRDSEWDIYCDIRDGFAIGTNAAIREKIKQSSKLDAVEPRYISKVE